MTKNERQPLVNLSEAGVDRFVEALSFHGFPFARIETWNDDLVAFIVASPPGIWLIDVTAATAPNLRPLIASITTAVKQEIAGATPVRIVRLRESDTVEDVEPDGTLRANLPQLTGRFFSPGPISQTDAAAAIEFLERKLRNSPALTNPG